MTAKSAHDSAARAGSVVCLAARFDDGFLGLAGDLARGLAGDLARGLAAARRGRASSLSSCLARAREAASALARLGRCMLLQELLAFVLRELLPQGLPAAAASLPTFAGAVSRAVFVEGLRLERAIAPNSREQRG